VLAYGFLRHAWHPWCSLIDSPHPSPTLVLRWTSAPGARRACRSSAPSRPTMPMRLSS